MSGLPEQVQRQAAEAEAYEAALAAGQGDPATPPNDPAQEPPAQPPAPQASAPAAPTPAPAPAEETWEQRYRTLQGMHRSDLGRLEGQVRELQTQAAAKDVRIQELEAAAKRTPEAPKPAPVSKEDTEKFGPEIIDLIDRQARHVADQQVGPLKQELEAKDAEIASLKKQVGGVAEDQGQARLIQYRTELTKLCPQWEATNKSQSFFDWLAVVDELSGLKRQVLLENAFNNRDAARTAFIFNQFLQLTPPAPPAPPAPAAPSLQSQTAPSGSKADIPPANPAADKVWTAQEVDAFYAAQRRGDYKPEDAARIEAEIDAAGASGRIR